MKWIVKYTDGSEDTVDLATGLEPKLRFRMGIPTVEMWRIAGAGADCAAVFCNVVAVYPKVA